MELNSNNLGVSMNFFYSFTLFLLFILAKSSFAYNSAGFPFSQITKNGNYIIISDTKSIVKKGDHYFTMPFTAKESSKKATGGISDSESEFIGCLESEAFIYKNETLIKKEFESTNIQCAMSGDGSILYFLKDRSKLIYDNKELTTNINFHGWFFNKGNEFIGVDENGYLYRFSGNLIEKISEFKLNNMDEYTSIAVKDDFLVQATSYGVYLVDLNNTEEKQRLPFSPCAEKQVCGVSIGEDQSIIVSGYWGSWFWKGETALKLSLSQISRKSGGTSISHVEEGGRYILISYDDADMGELPFFVHQNSGFSNINDDEYVFWSKKELDKYLFKYSLPGHLKSYVYISTHYGKLPKPIPDHWLYFEKNAEVDFEIPNTKSHSNFNNSSWWQNSIELDEAKVLTSQLTKRKVKIGIVDSGIDMSHPEFSHIDFSTHQLYDFVEEDFEPNDEHGHGTHVAGIILGHSTGVYPEANLVIAKALGKTGKSNSIDLSRAIVWTVNQKPDVINFSWGGGFKTQALRDAIEYGKSKQVLMLTSAGNSGTNVDNYPEVPISYGGLTAISSYTEKNKLAKHSNYGAKAVSFAAPGEDIYSTFPDENYKEMTGTSMAVAVATSIVAKLSSLSYPEHGFIAPELLIEKICTPAKGYWKKYTRCGKLGLVSALKHLGVEGPKAK